MNFWLVYREKSEGMYHVSWKQTVLLENILNIDRWYRDRNRDIYRRTHIDSQKSLIETTHQIATKKVV